MTAPETAARPQADAPPLLGPDEPAPFALENAGGRSRFVLVCEHGGARLPAALGTLGLEEAHLGRHFMVDIGALDLARALARALDAPLAHQRYSRMVCDCNRRPEVASFIPEAGEGVPVPGNAGLDAAARAARRAAIWDPFHAGVAALLDARTAAGPAPVLVTVHSFTPVFHGVPRAMQAGVLFDRDPHFSRALLGELAATLGERVAGNAPYAMSREGDYTVPVHGEDRGLPCTEIEIRNDLIGDAGARARWAGQLAQALVAAAGRIGIEL